MLLQSRPYPSMSLNHCPALKGIKTTPLRRKAAVAGGLNHCPALKGIKTESAAVDACCAPSLNHCPALKGIKTKVSEQYWTGEKGV